MANSETKGASSLCAIALSIAAYRASRADRLRLMRAEGNQLVSDLRGCWRDLEIECEEMIRIQARWDSLSRAAAQGGATGEREEWSREFVETMRTQARKLRSIEETLQLDRAGRLRGDDPADLERKIEMVRDALVLARNTLASTTRATQRMHENAASLESWVRTGGGPG